MPAQVRSHAGHVGGENQALPVYTARLRLALEIRPGRLIHGAQPQHTVRHLA